MSMSTTSTTTFELLKYSRAYSHSAQATQPTELEWQHFVNPVIRLMLDTRKTTDGRLESYRIRIVWTFSAGQDSMDVDRREVDFEDLDLLSYSSLPARQAAQGIPLKAVYQGAVVGLRYQYPCVPCSGTIPQYRRFQITFQNESSATNFTDCIRFVCPCKANPAPPARAPRPPETQLSLAASGRSATTTHIPMSMSRSSASDSRQSVSVMPGEEAPSKTLQPAAFALLPSPSLSRRMDWDTLTQPSQTTAPAPSVATPVSRPWSASTASSVVAHQSASDTIPSDVLTTGRAASLHGSSSDVETSFPSSSLPSSSPPPSSRLPARTSSPVLMPPPPVPAQMNPPRSSQPSQTTPTSTPRTASSATLAASEPSSSGPELKSDISATLRDSHGLYALSAGELEKLVAEVIREEGFAELMRNLDGMWKIKGLADIHT
ncbi:hypothetical protein BD311DRAFT_694895 [Dichomitus squalens]|uniref:Uncharacterized protein n=1 Tax=Dichomitus squalens TaxID=114155 RepID=A0A4Q9MLN3_9APHY|nr:hypothetical protein BD311DRAFT_694895 [Dichomitus squalens]